MTEDRRQKTEYRRKTRDARRRALTLIEIIVSLAIMAIVFAVIVPQFAIMRNNWDSKQAAAETLQNGRILTDHLNRNLSKAVKITDVSGSAEPNGFIVFQDNDGNSLRYDINSTSSYVRFGVVGSLSDLAGPVSQLQFTCYDVCDLDTPITEVNDIRTVEVQTTVTNSAELGQDKTLIASAYLRSNWNSGSDSDPNLVGWWKLDETSGLTAEDSSGNGNDGTLTNMTGTEWTAGMVDGALEFDGSNDYIDISVALPDTFTVAMWIYPAADPYWNALIVEHGDLGIFYYGNADSYLDYYDGGAHQSDFGLITFDSWNHVTVVYDAGSVNFYINGDAAGSASGLSAFTAEYIGNDEIGNQQFEGLIDDVRIYNRVLSAEEIAELANIFTYEEFTEEKVASDGTSITIDTPGSTSEGDLLIAAVATDGDTDGSMAPPGGEGWTEIDVGDYGTEVTLGAWWKLADASESSSHEFTWSGSEQAYAWMMRFAGHDPTNPINVSATNGESSSTPTSPAVTTTVDDCIILRLGGFDDGDITVDDPCLSGHTAITMDSSSSSGAGATYEEFTEEKVASDGTSITIDTPAGTSEDDLLIAAVVTEEDTSGSLAPPDGEGWTQINLDDHLTKVTLGVWWKLADASESSTHQFTWTGLKQAYGWIMRFTGHDTSSTIDATAVGGGKSASPESPAVTTTVASAIILRIGGFKGGNITVDAPGLSGHTAITMDKPSNKCSGGAGYVIQAGTGSSGTSNFLLTRSKEYRAVTIAIAPAVGGGGGDGVVSGGAGYVKQSAAGDSGTSDFALTASEESQMLTIAIAPEPDSGGGGGGEVLP